MERPPFFYAADVAHPVWDLTAQAADPEGGEELLEIHEDDRPQYGIITTQSCDLTEDRVTNPKKPWFQVAPLINAGALPDGLARDVARGGVKYLYWVQSPDVGDWIADLRIEMPLEKSWLVGRTPIAGFGTLEECQRFARHLGHLRTRQAIEPGVCSDVVDGLVAHLRSTSADQPAILDSVERVLLRVLGERTAPSALEVIVVPQTGRADAAAKKAFDDWYDASIEAAGRRGLALLPVSFQSRFTPDEYERLVVLDLDDLSPESA